MKVTGIIAEYNPFHNGHLYHLKKAKESSDFAVIVMSGDFVQRGEPAIYSKYLRTKAALSCGADLVLELPSAFAAASAEDFASCGVALLTHLGVVDTLFFGSEQGDVMPLLEAAVYLNREPEVFSACLKEELKKGCTWPQARITALEQTGGLSPEAKQALHSPNNILGVEYCKAILRQESPIKPVTLLRSGHDYHDNELEGGFASASALRKEISRCFPHVPEKTFFSQIPKAAMEIFKQTGPLFPGDFSDLLNYALFSKIREHKDLSVYEGMTEDLSDRMKALMLTHGTWESRINQLKSKQYTYTRISRSLLHLILGITSEQVTAYRKAGYAPYARVLGFRKEAAPLLSAIKENASIPLVTKTADAPMLLSGTALSMIQQDFYSSHLWQSVYVSKYGQPLNHEYNQNICIL